MITAGADMAGPPLALLLGRYLLTASRGTFTQGDGSRISPRCRLLASASVEEDPLRIKQGGVLKARRPGCLNFFSY